MKDRHYVSKSVYIGLVKKKIYKKLFGPIIGL